MIARVFEGSFGYDFWSIYLFDGAGNADAYARAYESRSARRISVGLERGLASLAAPQQYNFDAPVTVWVCESLACDESAWDHVVEFDLDVRTGTLSFGRLDGPDRESFSVVGSRYRARWSGCGFDDAYAGVADEGRSAEAYRLELAPCAKARPLVEIRRWHGFDDFGLLGS